MKASLRSEMIKKICVRDGDKILDVGCGDGAFLAELTRWKEADGYGTEPSETLVEVAKEVYPELHIDTGHSDFLAFDDNTFRIITVCDDFRKFDHPEKFVDEAARVLQPGGRLYIGEASFPEPVRLTLNAPSLFQRSKNRKRHSVYEILEMFKAAGLTKFRVYEKKRLLLVSAKKPNEE